MPVGKLGLDGRQVRRARTLAERVGRPIVDVARAHTTVSVERATLRLAGLAAEGAREFDEQQCIRPHRLDGADLLIQRIDQRGHVFRRHNGVGVTVKRDHQREAVVLPGIRKRLPDDLLMAQVNSIEDADCEADFASPGPQFGGVSDELHGKYDLRFGACRQVPRWGACRPDRRDRSRRSRTGW